MRNIFLLSVTIIVSMPLFNIFLTYPAFTALFTQITENEAKHIAEHFASMFIEKNSALKPDFFSEEFATKIQLSQDQFDLEKVKIFSNSGEVVYSTNTEDIGKINDHKYFYETVAKGQVFSKEVQKHNKTLEGRTVLADVVETYAPVMNGHEFQGAVEIYYDITVRKKQLAKLFWHSFIMLLALTGSLFVLIVMMLFKASKTISAQKQAEVSLKSSYQRFQAVMNSLDALVYVADMQTYEILFINKHGQTIWGDIVGRTCWQTLQDGQSGPCDFCTNEKLQDSSGRPCGVHVWEFQNTVNNRWYECRDQAIQWTDGRLVRMEIATDNTDRKQAEEVIKKKMNEQEVNIDLAKRILNVVNDEPLGYIELNGDLALFVEAVSAPCSAVGGDHYFVRNISANGLNNTEKTVISLKDQSGHEVNCVLRSIITDLIHNAILYGSDTLPLEMCISRLNDEICLSGLFKPDDFLTSINVEIDHKTLIMKYVSCGHPVFLLIRGSDISSFPGPGGAGKNLPIGAIEGTPYSSGELQLRENDKLFFYTDGLTEIPISGRKPRISLNELKNTIGSIVKQNYDCHITDIMRHVLDTISRSSGQEIIPGLVNTSVDDVTILGVEIENQKDYSHEVWNPQSFEHLSVLINKLYAKIAYELKQRGCELPELRVRGAVQEAILNAWLHGNQQEPNKSITVRWRYGNDFHFEVIDQGSGFDLKHLPDPRAPENLLKESGRGIFFIQHYTDNIKWKSGGSHIVASFKRNSNFKESETNKHHRPLMPLWQN